MPRTMTESKIQQRMHISYHSKKKHEIARTSDEVLLYRIGLSSNYSYSFSFIRTNKTTVFHIFIYQGKKICKVSMISDGACGSCGYKLFILKCLVKKAVTLTKMIDKKFRRTSSYSLTQINDSSVINMRCQLLSNSISPLKDSVE